MHVRQVWFMAHRGIAMWGAIMLEYGMVWIVSVTTASALYWRWFLLYLTGGYDLRIMVHVNTEQFLLFESHILMNTSQGWYWLHITGNSISKTRRYSWKEDFTLPLYLLAVQPQTFWDLIFSSRYFTNLNCSPSSIKGFKVLHVAVWSLQERSNGAIDLTSVVKRPV